MKNKKIRCLIIACLELSGCSQTQYWREGTYYPIWFNGKYYGPAPDAGSPQKMTADFKASPPRRPVAAKPSTASTPDLLAAQARMDRLFQHLSAEMTTDEQLQFSAEQTNWLNDKAAGCSNSGKLGDRCEVDATIARADVIAARLKQFKPAPPAPPAPAAVPAPPVLLAMRPPPAMPAAPPATTNPTPPSVQPAPPPSPAPPPAAAAPPAAPQAAAAQGAAAQAAAQAAAAQAAAARGAAAQPAAAQGAAAQPVAPQEAAAQPAAAQPVAPQPVAVPPAAVPPVPPAAPNLEPTYTVAATAMPWLWKKSTFNSRFRFGLQDGTPPTSISLSGLGAAPGQSILIHYVSGKIMLGFGTPQTDAAGYTLQEDDHGIGITGQPLPSMYIKSRHANLAALIGVFTDKSGNIVGDPFAVGDGPVRAQVPAQASQLQLGINDDIYGEENLSTANTGSLLIAVSKIPDK